RVLHSPLQPGGGGGSQRRAGTRPVRYRCVRSAALARAGVAAAALRLGIDRSRGRRHGRCGIIESLSRGAQPMSNTAKKYDLLIRNVRVVRPKRSAVQTMDIAVKDGKFARIAKEIRASDAATVVDGRNRLAFPGLVDPHMHSGIYAPLAEDALSESRA